MMTFPSDRKTTMLALGYKFGKSEFIRNLKAMKEDNIPYKIGVPPGTRLIGLTRHNNAWQLWLAIKNPIDNPSEWVGTYLLCHDDGSVLRIQNDIEPEDVFHVKLSDR